MYNDYMELNNKIITADENKLEFYDSDSNTLKYLENKNKISLIQELKKEQQEKLNKLGIDKGFDYIFNIFPGMWLMTHAWVLTLKYVFNQHIRPGVVGFGNVAVPIVVGLAVYRQCKKNKKYKLDKEKITGEIKDLEELELEYQEKGKELSKSLVSSECKVEKLNNKKLLEELKEELKTYSSETELDKPKEKTLGTI